MGKTSHTRVLVHKSNSMPGWIPSQKTSGCKCTQVRFSKTTIVTTRDSIVEYDNCDNTLKVHGLSILLCPGCPASDDPVTSSRDGRSSVVSSSLEKRRLLMRKIWCQVEKSKFLGLNFWGDNDFCFSLISLSSYNLVPGARIGIDSIGKKRDDCRRFLAALLTYYLLHPVNCQWRFILG